MRLTISRVLVTSAAVLFAWSSARCGCAQPANILEEEPAAPRGNRVFANVSFGGKWGGVRDEARKYQMIQDNLVGRDPRFTTPERLGEGKQPRAVDFALESDSPAWAVGFEKLPLEEMGLYEDETRASWPVTHKVR